MATLLHRLRSNGVQLRRLPNPSVVKAKRTDDWFVKTWNAARSAAEAQAALRTVNADPNNRACRLRKKGVYLKKFPPGPPPSVNHV